MDDNALTALHDGLSRSLETRGKRGGLGKGSLGAFRQGTKAHVDPKMPYIKFVPAGTSLNKVQKFGEDGEIVNEDKTSKKRKFEDEEQSSETSNKKLKKIVKKIFKTEDKSELTIKEIKKKLKKDHDTKISKEELTKQIETFKKFQVQGKVVKKV